MKSLDVSVTGFHQTRKKVVGTASEVQARISSLLNDKGGKFHSADALADLLDTAQCDHERTCWVPAHNVEPQRHDEPVGLKSEDPFQRLVQCGEIACVIWSAQVSLSYRAS